MLYSAFDKDRYRYLISRAVFDSSFYTGSVQDRSRNAMAVTATGTPTPMLIATQPAYTTNAASFGTAAVPAVITMATPVTFEFLQETCKIALLAFPFAQRNNIAGNWSGFIMYFSNEVTLNLVAHTGVGAATRAWAVTVPANRLNHIVITVDPTVVAGAGSCWCNGVPVVVATGGAGPGLTLQTDTAFQIAGANSGDIIRGNLYRTWQEGLTYADGQALYGAAQMFLEA